MNDVIFSVKVNPELKKKFVEKLNDKYWWGKEKGVIEEFMRKFIEGKCINCLILIRKDLNTRRM